VRNKIARQALEATQEDWNFSAMFERYGVSERIMQPVYCNVRDPVRGATESVWDLVWDAIIRRVRGEAQDPRAANR